VTRQQAAEFLRALAAAGPAERVRLCERTPARVEAERAAALEEHRRCLAGLRATRRAQGGPRAV